GSESQLYNLNIPTVALQRPSQLRVVPMGVARYGEKFEKRVDPRGRNYYWASGGLPVCAAGHETDLTALQKGYLTLTPLDFDLTKRAILAEMERWEIDLQARGHVG